MSVDTQGTEECFEVSKRKIFCLSVYIKIFQEHCNYIYIIYILYCNYIFLKLYFKNRKIVCLAKIVSRTTIFAFSFFCECQ